MNRSVTLPLLLVVFTTTAQTYSPSPLFGDAGAVREEIVSGSDMLNAHALLPDGKLLVAGFGYDIGINSFHVGLMRLDTVCGALDPTFGNGGSIAQTHQQRTTCHDIAVQPDGRIVGVGMIAPSNAGSQQKAGIFRFMPDGAVDSSFNGTGYHQALWDPWSSGGLWRAFINADGTITSVGESYPNINGGVNAIGAMRFTATGQFDTSFDGDGIATMPIGASQGTGVMRPDGRVLAVGETSIYPDLHLTLAQWNTDGTPDLSFGVGGWITIPFMISGTNDNGGMGASLLPDGRLLVSTVAPGNPEGFLMARFHTDGSPDSTYGVNGVSTAFLGTNITGHDHELLPDGSTLQFGVDNGVGIILKRDPDGQVVTGFGNNGFVSAVTGFGGETFRGGFTLPSGRIIGYGGVGSSALVVRLTTDPASEGFVDLGPDIAVCADVPVLLDAGSGTTYLWNDLSNTQTVNALLSGPYSVEVTDANGCTDSDTVQVVFFPLPPQPDIVAVGLDLSTTAIGDLQWNLNGLPILGATASTYTALQNGSYTVTVTDGNGCASTSVIADITNVAVHATGAPVAFSVYPVPVAEQLMVAGLQLTPESQVIAIDAAGRTHTLALVDRTTIDTRSLAGGSYILEMRTEQGVYRQRFVRR